jgi:hypothetical protein
VPVINGITHDEELLFVAGLGLTGPWPAYSFAGTGDPSSRALPWPSFNGTRMLSLVPLQSQVTTDFSTVHHCSFWAAG